MDVKNIKDITDERGEDYGHPIDQFNTTQTMYNIWVSRRESGISLPPVLENVLRHIVYMIIDKLVRLAENPFKQDGYDDIQGYASLWNLSVKEHSKREKNENSPIK